MKNLNNFFKDQVNKGNHSLYKTKDGRYILSWDHHSSCCNPRGQNRITELNSDGDIIAEHPSDYKFEPEHSIKFPDYEDIETGFLRAAKKFGW